MTMPEWRTVLVCGENVQFPRRKSGFFTEEFQFKGTTHLLQFKDEFSPAHRTRYYVDGVECECQTPQAFTQYFIALHSLTAWQYCNWVALDAAVDASQTYTVCDIDFYVYRASDGTCWQYYSEGDWQYYYYSEWYESAVVEPSKEHFGQWVASTVSVSK